ncbi:MAG: hypothetical protein AAFR53_02755 [Pseudomonadota bacterium]
MNNVVVLAHDEGVVIDATAFRMLRNQLGEAGANTVVSRAMEEIASRLSLIERSYYEDDRDALWRAAESLSSSAEQVGAVSLTAASEAIAECARVPDPVALAAVVGRLLRLGDRSLSAVWDMPQSSTY